MNPVQRCLLAGLLLLVQPLLAQRVPAPLLPDVATSGLYRLTNAFPAVTLDPGIVGFDVPPGKTNELYYYDRPGRVWVITNFAAPVRTLFLDVSDINRPTGDGGFLGLTFHPNYAQNRYFYAFFAPTNTANGKMYNRLSRFESDPANPLRALRNSEQILFDIEDESSILHNGGDLHFGPDGYLYVTMGDEGAQEDVLGNAQKIDQDLYSAILRLDVDGRPGSLAPNPHPAVFGGYRIPPDNPYIGATSFNGQPVDPAKVRTEFWAVGLRSPHRMCFDPLTGEIYLGDVGGDRVEEVDHIVRGGNYGWAYYEGNLTTPWRPNIPPGVTFNPPLHYYGRAGVNPEFEGQASIGGLVYRGTRYPELYGKYVFGDYVSKHIWAITFQAGGGYSIERLIDAETGPTSFGLDPATGEILIASNVGITRLVRNANVVTPSFPSTLSATGVFTNVASLGVRSEVIPYEVNSTFWSDHAIKQRWSFFQDATSKVNRSAADEWTFPAGMVWMKHFDLEMVRGVASTRRRVETRFLVKTADSIYGLSYRWRPDGSDADLVGESGMNEGFQVQDGAGMATHTQTWHYPARSECLSCHNRVAGFVLGFNTQQLNKTVLVNGTPTNQLALLSSLGYFAQPVTNFLNLPRLAPPEDTTATVEHRFKSYLDANCSYCHQPFGPGRGTWDGRLATPINQAGIIDGPVLDTFGIPGAGVIRLRDTNASIMWQRIANMGVHHMPPLATAELNTAGIDLVREFIETYTPTYRTVWQLGTPAVPGVSPTAEFSVQNNTNDFPPGFVTRLPNDPLFIEGANPKVDDDYYFSGTYPAGYNEIINWLSVPNDEPTTAWESGLTLGDRTNRMHFVLAGPQVAPGARLKFSFKFATGGFFSNGIPQNNFGVHDISVRFRNGTGAATPIYANRLTQPTEVLLDLAASDVQALNGPNGLEFVRTGPAEPGLSYFVTFDYVRIESVPITNTPPVFQPVAPVVMDENTTLTFNLQAGDTDLPANKLKFSKINGPPGLTVSEAGLVTWTPDETVGPSTSTVVVAVTDDGIPALTATLSFNVTVNEVNSGPVFVQPAPLSVDEQAPLSFFLTANDSDQPVNTLTWSLVLGPPGLTVSPAGHVVWTPGSDQGGRSHSVSVVVSDNGSPSRSAPGAFEIAVRDTFPNGSGQVRSLWEVGTNAPPGSSPGVVFGEFSVPNNRNDPAPGLVTRLPSDPLFLGVANPTADDDYYFAGLYPVGFNFLTQALAVPNDEPWSAWERAHTLGDRTNRIHFQLDSSRTTADTRMRFAVEFPYAGFSVNGVTQVGFGSHDMLIQFRNGLGLTTPIFLGRLTNSTNIVVEFSPALVSATAGANTIELIRTGPAVAGTSYWLEYDFVRFEALPPTNRPPVPAAVGPVALTELVPWSLQLTASDPDQPAQVLTYSMVSGPAGATVTPSGILSWLPSELQGPMVTNAVVLITDNGTPPQSATVTVGLTVAEANVAPVFVPPAAPVTVDEQVPVALTLGATDSDLPPNVLTWALVSGPAGLSVAPDGRVLWTPTSTQGPSNYPVSVTVMDNGVPQRFATGTFNITVRDTVLPGGGIRSIWEIGTNSPPGTRPPGPFAEFSPPNNRNDPAPGLVTRLSSDPLFLGLTNPTADDDYYFAGSYGPGFNFLTQALLVPNDEPWTAWERAHTLGDRTNRMHFVLDPSQLVTGTRLRLAVEYSSAGFSINGVAQAGFGDHDLLIQFRNGLGVVTPVFTGRLTTATNLNLEFTPAQVSALAGPNSIEFVRTGPAVPGVSYWLEYDFVRFQAVVPALLPPQNQPPVPGAVPLVEMDELLPLSFQLSATDSDDPPQKLSFLRLAGPAGLAISPSGLVTWTPTEEQGPSTNTVSVSVSDDGVIPQTVTFQFTIVVRELAGSRTVWAIGTDAPPGSSPAATFGEFGMPDGVDNAPPGGVTRRPGDSQYLPLLNPVADDDFYFTGVYPRGFNFLTSPLVVPQDEPAEAWERAHTLGDRTNRMHFQLEAPQAGAGSSLRLAVEYPYAGFAVDGVVRSGYGDHDLLIQFRNGLGVVTPLFAGRLSTPSNVVVQFNSTAVQATPGANSIEFIRTGPAIPGTSYWLEYDHVRLEQVLTASTGSGGSRSIQLTAAAPELVSNLRAAVTTVEGVEYLAIIFDRPEPPPAGFGYVVEASGDLYGWSDQGVATVRSTVSGNRQTMEVRDAAPLKQETQRFLRLRVVPQ